MGFLSAHPALEAWLRTVSSVVRSLDEREYRRLVATWRARFEASLASRAVRAGLRAEEALLRSLPRDVYVFSIPGYRYLPAATDPKVDPVYAFEASALTAVDFSILHPEDAVIADTDLTFSCLFTHEVGELADTVWVDTPMA